MFIRKAQERLPGRRTIAPRINRGSLFTMLLIAIGCSQAESAESDVREWQAEADTSARCSQIQNDLSVELNRRFKRTDKADLADRRRSLNNLAGKASSTCAVTLIESLMVEGPGDTTLFKLFHDRLAKPTREQVLSILDRRACCAMYDDSHAGEAENDVECLRVQEELTVELNRKFRSTDKEGLANRRKNLNTLFENTSRSCATMLVALLGEKRNDAELSRLFHYKLARATRKELLDILGGPSRPSFFRRVVDGASNQAVIAEK